MRGRGELRGLSQWVQLYEGAQINFGFNSIFNLSTLLLLLSIQAWRWLRDVVYLGWTKNSGENYIKLKRPQFEQFSEIRALQGNVAFFQIKNMKNHSMQWSKSVQVKSTVDVRYILLAKYWKEQYVLHQYYNPVYSLIATDISNKKKVYFQFYFLNL